MIRKFEKSDIEQVMEIWLETNIKAHSFIDKSYWENNYSFVKDMLPQAEIYLYEEGDKILGFIGLLDEYIAGIFVREDVQSKGVGKLLLDYVKNFKSKLSLHVYSKNQKAINFYFRENFKNISEQIDENTKEKEILMIWEK